MGEKFANFHTVRRPLTEKKFSQINYLAISLVKPMLSRNFCKKKSVRNNFCDLVSHIWQKFRELNVFTKEISRVNLTKYF